MLKAQRVAAQTSMCWITGGDGCGKEVFSRLHSSNILNGQPRRLSLRLTLGPYASDLIGSLIFGGRKRCFLQAPNSHGNWPALKRADKGHPIFWMK